MTNRRQFIQNAALLSAGVAAIGHTELVSGLPEQRPWWSSRGTTFRSAQLPIVTERASNLIHRLAVAHGSPDADESFEHERARCDAQEHLQSYISTLESMFTPQGLAEFQWRYDRRGWHAGFAFETQRRASHG